MKQPNKYKPFTDDDLKKLKEAIKHQGHVDWNNHANREVITSLLARLEEAEALYCHYMGLDQ
jgi:hypothetical protein